MAIDQVIAELLRYIDKGRGRETVAHLIQSWIHDRTALHQPAITPELIYAIADLHAGWPTAEHYTPKALASFIAKIAGVHSAQSILDPTCGLGLLLGAVAASTGATSVDGVEVNRESYSIARAMLGESARIFHGDALAWPEGLHDKYDLIIANPPLGVKVHAPLTSLGTEFRGELGYALTILACNHLNENGTIITIVTPAFFWSKRGLGAQEAVRANGCRIRAVIHLPGGTLPHTGMSTYLAVIDRGPQQEVFVGEFADNSEHQKTLIGNYKRGKSGARAALGRFCPLAGFRGFEAFEAQERLKRLIRSTGWPTLPASSVITKWMTMTEQAPEPFTNCLYLRLIGEPPAVLDPSSLRSSAHRDAVRLDIDEEKSDARYLVHWFNQTPIGRATLDSVTQGGVMQRVNLDNLMKETLALPPLGEQRQVLLGLEHLTRVRAETDMLENALWMPSESAEVVAQQILSIRLEDRYEDWIETLPFPLASILWRHRAGGGTIREQYEVLLHFFEATAAFVATIHLSAFMADEALWSEVARGLHGALEKQKLSLERATFGAWRVTTEYFSGKCRKLLADESGREMCARIYGSQNERIIAMLCHSGLLSTLQRANSIRNTASGHAGAIGQDEAQRIHVELKQLVEKIRGVFGRSWLNYELVQPSDSRYQEGIFHYKAKRLMGTRSTPFEVVERESSVPLDSDCIYLLDAVGQKGLKLRPFIRVMPSPEKKANACFIYSSHEGSQTRYLSYHFEEESTMKASFPDVDETLRQIHRFDATGHS